jgi:hypothetical protein
MALQFLGDGTVGSTSTKHSFVGPLAATESFSGLGSVVVFVSTLHQLAVDADQGMVAQ